MKFLFDQNISHKITKLLPEDFSDSTTVKFEGLINASDREIWEFAKKFDYIIVTQDSDFNDLSLLFGFPPKVVWIRTGNLRTNIIADILIQHSNELELFINDDKLACFEIFIIKNKK